MNPLHELHTYGQSIWLDYIRRRLITGGELQRLVEEDGLRGVTSNPTIFQKAIAGNADYDAALRALLEAEPYADARALYEALAIEDIRMAADVLRPVYDATGGTDGFVSLEVSPHLAHDTEGTVAEARRLWQAVDRPNLMIKVPATPLRGPAGPEAIPCCRGCRGWNPLPGGVGVSPQLSFLLQVVIARARRARSNPNHGFHGLHGLHSKV